MVHSQHGVGKYVEMVQRSVASATREYLVIEYALSKRGQPGDRLFVPTDQLDRDALRRGEAPAVHRRRCRLAEGEGRARKGGAPDRRPARKTLRDASADQGSAFRPRHPWQRELEDAFPYQETPDQLACIDEVKSDMAQPLPMDRVIAGDAYGSGKTEIAVRAAFKAVADGTQVVVLVPGRPCSCNSICRRSASFAPFPVKVAHSPDSRPRRSPPRCLRGLRTAASTWSSNPPTPRARNQGQDLGLVIDEEQRFGVEHKEHQGRYAPTSTS